MTTHAEIRTLLRERGMCGQVGDSPGLLGAIEPRACVLPIGHDLGSHEIGVAELAAELGAARSKIGELERTIEALDQHKSHAAEVIKQLGIDKESVYRERNRLVAALARIALTRKCGSLSSNPAIKGTWQEAIGKEAADRSEHWTSQWNAGLARHPEGDVTWDREWMTIVFINTPAGQLSWHIHDADLPLFQGLAEFAGAWDGHTTEEKYRRLELVR